MSSLFKRVLSAAVAILLLVLAYSTMENLGVAILSGVVALLALYEYQRVAFARFNLPWAHHFWIFINCLSFSLLSLFSREELVYAHVGVLSVVLIVGTIWINQSTQDVGDLLQVIGLSLLGLFYCAMIPTLVIKTVLTPKGMAWFGLLCCVVFSGDILAYFIGRAWGKTKLAPSLSPNKTVEGAAAGFAGSVVIGYFIGTAYLPHVPATFIIIVSAFCAMMAQTGDLFESLLKRVSNVKDSGNIMPGHGGVLDRIDGVYFAAPLVYFAAFSYGPFGN